MAISSKVHIPITVIGTMQHDDGVMSIRFRRPAGFTYESGDWTDLVNSGEDLRGGKTYSFSSAPTEDELVITFRNGISPFKQYLQRAQPGDVLIITQYGNGYGFHMHENRSSVLIAGGIGIAPLRSMLKEMADTGNTNQVQLLYFNKGRTFLFADEITEWAQRSNLDVRYYDTNELKRKDRQKIFLTVMNRNARQYFIAGPEGMVESTEHTLLELGISPKDIRIDNFGNY